LPIIIKKENKMKFAICGFALAFGAVAFAADAPSTRDRVFQFLEKNVMGRTQQLATEGTIEAEGATYQVKFSATIKWDKLEKTEEGLTFEETRDIKQSNIKRGAAGKAEETVTDRVVVFRHALGERETAKALVGVSNMTKNTLEDPTGKASVTMIELSTDDKELYLYQSLAGFGEASLDGKTIIPVANASEATLSLDAQGKLNTNETIKFYKVDVNKDFAREELHRFNLSAVEVKK